MYCTKAKTFFRDNDLKYDEVYYDPNDITYDERKNALVEKTHHYTFPQIFIGERFVGGYKELMFAHSTLQLHDWCRKIGQELEVDF